MSKEICYVNARLEKQHTTDSQKVTLVFYTKELPILPVVLMFEIPREEFYVPNELAKSILVSKFMRLAMDHPQGNVLAIGEFMEQKWFDIGAHFHKSLNLSLPVTAPGENGEWFNAQIVQSKLTFDEYQSTRLELRLKCNTSGDNSLKLYRTYSVHASCADSAMRSFGFDTRLLAQIADIKSWDALDGRYVRVRRGERSQISIGHLFEDTWTDRFFLSHEK